MAGDKFLERYGGQTTEELLALENEYRIDSLVLAFEEAIGKKAFAGPITTEEAYVLAVEALEREAITRDAISALDLAGDLTPERMVDAVHPDNEAVVQARGGCDDRYFSNDEPIADRLFEWIRQNRAAIQVGGA